MGSRSPRVSFGPSSGEAVQVARHESADDPGRVGRRKLASANRRPLPPDPGFELKRRLYATINSLNGRQKDLGSLVVYAPLRDGDGSDGDIHTVLEDRVYIPDYAVRLINRAGK